MSVSTSAVTFRLLEVAITEPVYHFFSTAGISFGTITHALFLPELTAQEHKNDIVYFKKGKAPVPGTKGGMMLHYKNASR